MKIEDLFFKNILTQAKKSAPSGEVIAKAEVQAEAGAKSKTQTKTTKNSPKKTPQRDRQFDKLNDKEKKKIIKTALKEAKKDESLWIKKEGDSHKYLKLPEPYKPKKDTRVNQIINNTTKNKINTQSTASASASANVFLKADLSSVVSKLDEKSQESFNKLLEMYKQSQEQLNQAKDEKAKAELQAKISEYEKKASQILIQNDVNIQNNSSENKQPKQEQKKNTEDKTESKDDGINRQLLVMGWKMLDDQEKKSLNDVKPGLLALLADSEKSEAPVKSEEETQTKDEGQKEQTTTAQTSTKEATPEEKKNVVVHQRQVKKIYDKQAQKPTNEQIQNLYFKGVLL